MRGIFLLTIGDEILDGRIQNTNATWFGEQFRSAGLPVVESRSVSDRLEAISRALKEASKQPIVVVTGGLGPTNDDRTLEGAARAFRLALAETPASLKHVRSRYEARGLPVTPARLKMALVPKGGRVLENPRGTAPGIQLKVGASTIFFLPGPPLECRPMFEKFVLPVAARAMHGKRIVRREFWRTFGRGESDVYQRVRSLVEELERNYPEGITFGVHITFPYIDLTLEVRKAPAGKGVHKAEIDQACQKIEAAIGSLCFTREREGLAEAVARLLREKKKTVATAESCTGGLLGKMLTDLAGSSDYYLGGVVSYANSAKEKLLSVNKKTLQSVGAVSSETVTEMAESIRAQLGADYALSISGIAGPGGATPAKPLGTTFVGIANRKGTRTVHQVILQGQGTREQNRVIAAHLALDALRAELLGRHDSRFPVN